ncbi:hypothetical protein INR49_002103, partial [Caranx melampygus]
RNTLRSNGNRGTHFRFGPVAGAAAVTALRLAQIETQAQIALQQLAFLATVTVTGNQYHNNSFAAVLPSHLALLSLLNRQEVSAVGISRKPTEPHNRVLLLQCDELPVSSSTQLPDELESALAIRGGRDMDHRLIDHMNPPSQHQNQGSGSGISQHGTFGSNPVTLTSDSQPGHQQGIDWSSYQPPTKLFASPPPSTGHQSQRHQGPPQQPESSHTATSIPNWTAPDWVDHINTVNHTAACRDLRNKYPHWKPNPPSRDVRYGSQALWDPKDHSPSHSMSRSLSGSPSPGPPHSKHGLGPHPHGPHGKLYSPHPRYPPRYPEHGHRLEYRHSGSRSPSHSHRTSMSSREHRPERGRHLTLKPPPAKKKKKIAMSASQDLSVAERLVYLTGIPNDASEQEVTDLVGSFGKINNVILMPCSEEESKKGEGQKASVCMVKAEDAQALANSTNLFIREQQITTSIAKKPEEGQSTDANSSKPPPGKEKAAAGEDSGLPESNWSESDIIKLIQPFGTPSDIILASQIERSALVSVPDMEIAEEIVKVHTFIPAKINDSDLKITQVKQRVGLNTPVLSTTC